MKEVKTYSYKKDGTFIGLKIIEEGVDKSPKKLEDELVQDTTDVLTATLTAMKDISFGESCESTHEIFDGTTKGEGAQILPKNRSCVSRVTYDVLQATPNGIWLCFGKSAFSQSGWWPRKYPELLRA